MANYLQRKIRFKFKLKLIHATSCKLNSISKLEEIATKDTVQCPFRIFFTGSTGGINNKLPSGDTTHATADNF
jgi:hypothetical protein